MESTVMDALRIGLTAAAVILALKYLFGSLLKIPGLTPMVMAI